MTKLGEQLIKSLEDALKYERGEIELRKTRIEMTPDGKIERDYGKEDLNKEPTEKADGTLEDKMSEDHRKMSREIEAVVDKKSCKKCGMKDCKCEHATGENINQIPDSHDKFEPAQKKEKKVDLDEMVEEHERLVDVLESPSREDDKKEAKTQTKELKEYKEEASKQEFKECDGYVNKSMFDRWNDLKKALNSDVAIMDLEEAQADPEEEEQEAPPEGGVEEQDMDMGAAAEEEVEDAAGPEAAEEYAEENPEMAAEGEEGEEGEEGGEEEDAEAIIVQALQDEGYSDTEIAHILHGHAPPQVDPLDQAKIDATQSKQQYDEAVSQHDLENRQALSQLDAEHKQRMNDAEFEGAQHKHSLPKMEAEHKQRMLDLQYEEANQAKGAQALDVAHKKRMLDLEYEMTVKEKEMELKYKEEELKEKARIKSEDMRSRQKERDMVRDAKQTSKKEKEGKATPLNKSEDILTDDEIEKGEKPGWGRSQTGQLYHPEHGHVNVMHEGGKFTIRHAPQGGGSRRISSHDTKEEAKSALLNFMKNPKGMVKIPGGTVGGH